MLERLLMFSIAAAAWPFWGPFVRRVIEEIKIAADYEDEPPPRRRRQGGRHAHLVNSAWDDLHLGRRGRSHFQRDDHEGFVNRSN